MQLPPCERIVVGSDLSKGSDAATRLAVAWAAQGSAEILIVHAAPELRAASHPDVEHALRVQADESAASECGIAAKIKIVDAEDVAALVSLATSDGDWLCVGCEGGAATVLRQAGHVPSRLAASASRALLLAPLGWAPPPRRRHRAPAGAGLPARRRAPTAFQRILVGLSGGSGDSSLVSAAAALAQATQGTLSFVHVIDIAGSRHEPPAARLPRREEADARAARERERLIDLTGDLVPLELAARSEVQVHVIVQGPPERDLAGLARSQSIDLLLVGTGPIAARLAAFAPCAVLVLP